MSLDKQKLQLLNKKRKFTKAYVKAPYEEAIIWSHDVPQEVRDSFGPPRRFATRVDAFAGKPVKTYED